MRCRLLALMLPFALIGCQGNFFSRFMPKSPASDDAAYQVYSDLFSEKDTVGITPGQLVIIQRETVRGGNMSFDKDISKCFPQNWEFRWEYGSALADYNKQNKTPRELTHRFNLASPYQLLPHRQILALETAVRGSGTAFAEKYPNSDGYISVSAVGFNRGRMRAIVFAAHWGNFGGGLERYYALEKKSQKWAETHAGCTANVDGVILVKKARAASIP